MSVSLVNHVGVTVPDIDTAFTWYQNVLGCYGHVPPTEVTDDGSYFGNLVKNLFGERFEGMRIAHLTTADGIGIELFQFLTPATEVPERTFEYWRGGIFHFCLTVDSVETTAATIAEAGGRQLSKVWRLFNNKDYEVAYCQDPWGTVIELCNRPYTAVWANHEPPGNAED